MKRIEKIEVQKLLCNVVLWEEAPNIQKLHLDISDFLGFFSLIILAFFKFYCRIRI